MRRRTRLKADVSAQRKRMKFHLDDLERLLPTTTSNISQSQFQGLSYGGFGNAQQPAFGSNQTQQQQPLQQQQHAQSQAMQGQEQAMGQDGAAATAPFLRDFTLVAEAVKRVQMDAVMTEMESITL